MCFNLLQGSLRILIHSNKDKYMANTYCEFETFHNTNSIRDFFLAIFMLLDKACDMLHVFGSFSFKFLCHESCGYLMSEYFHT